MFQQQYKETTLKVQSQLQDARKQIEELEVDKAMAIASAKQQMHETMEAKDQEISKVRDSYMSAKAETDQVMERLQAIEHKGMNIFHVFGKLL